MVHLMIKILFILFLIPSIALGGSATIGGVAVEDIDTLGGVAIEDIASFGGVSVSIAPSGTYSFYLNFEYPGDTDRAYTDSGGGTINGSASGATIDTWANFGIAGPTGGGTYGVKLDANDETIDYTITALDIIDTSEGTIALDIYFVTSTGINTFVQVGSDDDEMTGEADANNYMDLQHQGDASTVNIVGTDAIPDTTWTTIRISWSVISNEISTKVGANGWETDVDASPVTAFASAAATLEIGDGGSGDGIVNTFYIDNFRISKTYQDADL